MFVGCFLLWPLQAVSSDVAGVQWRLQTCAVSHFVLEKSKWWAGRGGAGRGVAAGACVGGLNPRRCRNEGLGSGCLTRPLVFTGRPSSQLGPWGPRFRKPFFFFFCPEVFCLLLKEKQDFSQLLAAHKPHQKLKVPIALAAWIGLWGAEGR